MLTASAAPLHVLFENEKTPQLLYITKHEFGGAKCDRPAHSHDVICEILFIYRGMGIYRVNSTSYAISEGDLVYSNPGEQHELVTSLDSEIGSYCFGMTDFQRKDLPPNHIVPVDSAFIRSSDKLSPFFSETCEFLYQNVERAPSLSGSTPLVFASFLSLALEIEESLPQHPKNSPEFVVADRVKRYIDKNYLEPLSLELIARELACSAPYISHAFKAVIGYSPMQYMTRCRIGLAQNFLIASDYTATRIATMVGYENTNYFNTVFTKIVGTSPIQYRKKYLATMRGDHIQ